MYLGLTWNKDGMWKRRLSEENEEVKEEMKKGGE